MQPPKILPPHYFVLSVLSMVGIAFLTGRGLISNSLIYVGVVPMLIGVAIAVKASRQFGAAGTNIIPLSQSTALVTDGAFNWMRNPMYTGMISFLVGLALVLDSLWVWPVVVVFFILIRQLFVMREEQLMVQTFGDEYTAYQRRVRRWV
jgi:protein-S-isoprenylcysteine O-methyltransferase Ste14